MNRYKSFVYKNTLSGDDTPDSRSIRKTNFETFNTISSNFKKPLTPSLADYSTYKKETSTSYVAKPFDAMEWASATKSTNAQAILDTINNESYLSTIQQYYDLYMASNGISDKVYRLGSTIAEKNVSGQESIVDKSGQLEPDGSMYTNVGFRLNTHYQLTNGSTADEVYSSLLFPPYTNKVSSTLSEYIESGSSSSSTFNTRDLKMQRYLYALRTPAFKSINDNIMFWQYILEGVTGIVSTYLTEWDLSVYIQEGIISHSAENPGVLWLLNRIQDDNPLYSERNKSAVFGVMNTAMSQVFNDNEMLWYPGLYPYSSYWTEYPRAYDKCTALDNGLAPYHYCVVEDLATKYPSGSGNLTLSALEDKSLKESVVVLDQIGAACSGYSSEWILNYYKVLHTTEDTSLSQYDLNQLTYLDNGKVIDLSTNNVLEWSSQSSDETDSADTVTDSDTIGIDLSTVGSSEDSDYSVMGITINGSRLLKMFLKRDSYKAKAMEQANAASSRYSASDYIASEQALSTGEETTEVVDTSDMTSEQISALLQTEEKSNIAYDELEGSHTSVSIGVPQRNPTLFGGPHGYYLSPKVPQAFFEESNPFLRNNPHNFKGTYTYNGNYYNNSSANVIHQMAGSKDTSTELRDRAWTPAYAKQLFANGYSTYSVEKVFSTTQHRVYLGMVTKSYITKTYINQYQARVDVHYYQDYPDTYTYNGKTYPLYTVAQYGDTVAYKWVYRRNPLNIFAWEWVWVSEANGLRAFYFYTQDYTDFKRYYMHDDSDKDWSVTKIPVYNVFGTKTPCRSTSDSATWHYSDNQPLGYLQINGETNKRTFLTTQGIQTIWNSNMDKTKTAFALDKSSKYLLYFGTKNGNINSITRRLTSYAIQQGYEWQSVQHVWYSTESVYYTWYTVVCGAKVWHSEWRTVSVPHYYTTWEWVWIGWNIPTILVNLTYDTYYAPPGLRNGMFDTSGSQVNALDWSLEDTPTVQAEASDYESYPLSGHGILACIPGAQPSMNFIDTASETYSDKMRLLSTNGGYATTATTFRNIVFRSWKYSHSYADTINIFTSPSQSRGHTVGNVPVYVSSTLDTKVQDYLRKLYSSITWYKYGETLPSWATLSSQGPLLHALCLRQLGFIAHLKELMAELNWKAVSSILREAVDNRVYEVSNPNKLVETNVYYNVWISEARKFFDTTIVDVDSKKAEFNSALDSYTRVLNDYLSSNSSSLHKIYLDYSYDMLETQLSFIENIGKNSYTKNFAKYIMAYLNILYEYRKYFINKRCNKSDGTLTMVRNLEKVIPSLLDYAGATQPVPDFTGYTPGISDGNALDVVFYKVQNSAVQKNKAALGEVDALGADRIIKVYVPVEFATVEDYNNQKLTGKEVIKTSLGEYVFKPADGTYYLSSKEYQANLANKVFNETLSESNLHLAKTVDDTIDYCETYISWSETNTPIFRGKTSSIDLGALIQSDEAYSPDMNAIDVFCESHVTSCYWTVDVSEVSPKADAYQTEVQIVPKGVVSKDITMDDIVYAVTGVSSNLLSPILDRETNTVVGTVGLDSILKTLVKENN